MTHDFNYPFLDCLKFAVEPSVYLSRTRTTIDMPAAYLVVEGMPSKMFEAMNTAECLYIACSTLQSRFSRQALDYKNVSLTIDVTGPDYELSYSFATKTDSRFSALKHMLLTTFGDITITIRILHPFVRTSLVCDTVINLLNRKYIDCRGIQNTYECQNVLF